MEEGRIREPGLGMTVKMTSDRFTLVHIFALFVHIICCLSVCLRFCELALHQAATLHSYGPVYVKGVGTSCLSSHH